MVVHWNAIPYYLGSKTKIRAYDASDIAAVGPLIHQLLARLPDLRAVILGGGAAQDVWRINARAVSSVQVIECPHPAPTNVNTRPGTWDQIVAAWRKALKEATELTKEGGLA